MSLNLTTATPSEIDTEIAELEAQIWAQREIVYKLIERVHSAVGDRKRYYRRTPEWGMSRDEALAKLAKLLDDPEESFIDTGGRVRAATLLPAIEAARAEIDRLTAEVDKREVEYVKRGRWNRFHRLNSTKNARIHRTRWCQGLHRSNQGDLGWHPELSGKSDEQAVAELGPVMCSKCFPEAPVEWRQDPQDLHVDPDACPGAGEKPAAEDIRRVKNYTGDSFWANCPKCGAEKKLAGGTTLPRHKRKVTS